MVRGILVVFLRSLSPLTRTHSHPSPLPSLASNSLLLPPPSVFLPMLHAAQSFERESTRRLIGSEIFPSAAPGVFLSDILLLASNKRAASSVFLHLPPGAHRYNAIKEQTHNYTQTAFKCSDDLLKMKLVNSKMISGEVMNSTFRF